MKQNKTIFFVLVAILVIVFIYWIYSFLIVDMNQNRKVKQGIIATENDFKRLSHERANYTAIKDAQEKQLQYFDTLKVHIPYKENLKGANSYIETLDIIQRTAKNNNVSISGFRPVLVNTFPEINVTDKHLNQKIERYLLELECNGNFISIGKFLKELNTQDRTINILKFNIGTEYGIKGGLFCEALLYTYVFTEKN